MSSCLHSSYLISGFRRDVNEICTLLGFLDYLSPEDGTGRLSRDTCTELSFLTA